MKTCKIIAPKQYSFSTLPDFIFLHIPNIFNCTDFLYYIEYVNYYLIIIILPIVSLTTLLILLFTSFAFQFLNHFGGQISHVTNLQKSWHSIKQKIDCFLNVIFQI